MALDEVFDILLVLRADMRLKVCSKVILRVPDFFTEQKEVKRGVFYILRENLKVHLHAIYITLVKKISFKSKDQKLTIKLVIKYIFCYLDIK